MPSWPEYYPKWSRIIWNSLSFAHTWFAQHWIFFLITKILFSLDTWKGLEKSLKYLILDSNKLSEIPASRFTTLEHLEELRLSHNSISSISHLSDLTRMKRIRKVYADHNQIANFPKVQLEKIRDDAVESLERFDLSSNPIICDCEVIEHNLRIWRKKKF